MGILEEPTLLKDEKPFKNQEREMASWILKTNKQKTQHPNTKQTNLNQTYFLLSFVLDTSFYPFIILSITVPPTTTTFSIKPSIQKLPSTPKLTKKLSRQR